MIVAFFRFVAVLIVLGGASALALAIYAWDYNEGAGPLKGPKTVVLPHGEGFVAIVGNLTREGVIDQPLLFEGIAIGLGQARKFKAGEYYFAAGATPKSVITMIASGQVVVHKLTIPEGLTVREVLALVDKEPALSGDAHATPIIEGSLLPETYNFKLGDSRKDMITRMQADMKTLMESLWQKRKAELPYMGSQQALTLASIVEKETGVRAERGKVAAVFLNRLRLNMRLQSDPTVAYGLEQQLGAPLGRALTSDDLRSNTPYNTYMIDGLPPGPIANPGRASIEAVLNPPDTSDLYFVASGTGGHRFAATLEEHNRNVQLYRQAIAGQ
jgi:UPF0755 protein